MGTRSRAATVLRWALGAGVLAGLCAPTDAHAARKYVCESLMDGYCVATKDTQFVECACADGEVYEYDAPQLEGVSDDQLRDVCWEYFRESCIPTAETVTCEDPQRGSCEASNGSQAWIDCACNDGSRDADLQAGGLAELEGDDLETACYEHLDTMCPPPPPPQPSTAPPPLQEDRAAAGCSVHPNAGASLLPLFVLLPLLSARRRSVGRSC